MRRKILLAFIVFFSVQALTSSCGVIHNKKMYMRRTYKKIRKSVKEADVSNLNDTVKVLFPSNLMFAVDSFSISKELLPTIERFANVLNKFDKTAILITGYTDSLGTEEYNNNLSSLRANTAKNALQSYDVLPSRINTWGMGERHPISSNLTEDGRAKNRRVEFVILYKD